MGHRLKGVFMPDLTDAAHQAKSLARRGAHAATAVLDASFHPFRTVRSLVHTEEAPTPPPTDAKTEITAPTPTQPPAPRRPVQAVPEPIETPPDLPVEPRGPAPHMPPHLADEIERDYGDELPGFRNGDEPPAG
jgi:hypothetical protein